MKWMPCLVMLIFLRTAPVMILKLPESAIENPIIRQEEIKIIHRNFAKGAKND